MLHQLFAYAPSWFVVKTHTSAEIKGTALPDATAWSDVGIDLIIRFNGQKITVAESSPGTKLPKSCPERHIQGDTSFCLGLRPVVPVDQGTAQLWWAHLQQYLQCQHIAGKVGIWSIHHSRDHGAAGELQEEAIALAEELDLSEEYERAYEGKTSWITDQARHILHKDGRPINGRSPCPRGCHWKNRPSRPVVSKDCKHRAQICRLVLVERKRRAALTQFWNDLKITKAQCCGTMRDCPLRQQK